MTIIVSLGSLTIKDFKSNQLLASNVILIISDVSQNAIFYRTLRLSKKGQNIEVEIINHYFCGFGFVKVLSERVSITTGPASAVVNATQGAAVGSATKIA